MLFFVSLLRCALRPHCLPFFTTFGCRNKTWTIYIYIYIYINETTIEWSSLEKDLGVYVDAQLSFNDHTETVVKMCMQLIGWVARAFKTRNAAVLLPVYKAIIRPKIEYASVVWNTTQKGQAAKIERVQRAFTRMIDGMKGLTYKQRLTLLGLENLVSRRQYNDLAVVRNIMIGDRSSWSQLFQLANVAEAVNRGHAYKLHKQRFATQTRKCFFTERVVNSWNAVPDDVIQSIRCRVFFDLLRDHVCRLNSSASSPWWVNAGVIETVVNCLN